MVPSFVDSSLSGLLCVEDNNSVFLDDSEIPRGKSSYVPSWHHQANGLKDGGKELLLSDMSLSVELLNELLEKQSQYMPRHDYANRLRGGDLDIAARNEAIDWIKKVHDHFRLGPLSAYLSVRYFDRFISSYELPKSKHWMTQLLAVACVSLAAKLEEVKVPLSPDLQVVESNCVFEARTVRRMELLVMNQLSWRMQAVTPFSFIDHFLWKINGDKRPPEASILKSIQIILKTVEAIEFLEFKPSDIAAAVAVSVEVECRTVEPAKAILILSHYVEKERIDECMGLIHNLFVITGSTQGATVGALPQSPIGVLDTSCWSYRSDEPTFISGDDSSEDTPRAKRPKINR
ncbi:hypothetical protein SAY86_021177 [Trapa natans]|uniref:B-like cyclin n=1 Tax=Trapa natans TaxID=22666 RepID=A0AAN7RFG3_TRANT|nr:hypothetical protein SAY86_021177 [Trapa natans]